jgi:hypothetical protein
MSEAICEKTRLAPVENKMREHDLRWVGHVQWRPTRSKKGKREANNMSVGGNCRHGPR